MSQKKTIVLFTRDNVLSETLDSVVRIHLSDAELKSIRELGESRQLADFRILLLDADSLSADDYRLIAYLQKINPHLHLLLLNGLDQKEPYHDEIYSRANVIFRKPFDNKLLIGVIENILES